MIRNIRLSMDALSMTEKLLLMVGLAIAPSIGALDISSLLGSENNLSLIYMCCRKSQNILVLGAVMTSLSRYKSQYWHASTTTVCLLGLIIGQVVSLYYNLYEFEGRESTHLYVTMLVFSISSLILFYLMTCQWGYDIIKSSFLARKTTPNELFAGESKATQQKRGEDSKRQMRNRRRSTDGDEQRALVRDPSSTIEQIAFDSQAHQNVMYPYLYVSLSLICFTGLMALMIQFTLNFVVTDTNLFGMNLAYIVFEILLLVYALRKSKFDVFQALCAVKEAKQIFVRYISHELRTPLNTAFLGLKLLVDDFKDSDNEVDMDRYDTIDAINKSVLHAVEILNGILTFDRIEDVDDGVEARGCAGGGLGV